MCVYMHTHLCPNFPLSYMRIFALIHVDGWGASFPYPILTFSLPYLTSSQAPPLPQLSCPALPQTGWPFWSGEEGKGALWHSSQQSWLNVLFPISVISPVASKQPREKEQRSGVYRMSVFKVTLCVSHFFFFNNKTPFLVVDNNTKRTLVKGEKNSKNRGIVNFQVLGLFVEGERRRWSLPGGPIFFQLKGKIFLCRDSILLNTFYNVMIIKKKFGHFKAGRRNQISFNIFSLLLLRYACHCMITLSFPLF